MLVKVSGNRTSRKDSQKEKALSVIVLNCVGIVILSRPLKAKAWYSIVDIWEGISNVFRLLQPLNILSLIVDIDFAR